MASITYNPGINSSNPYVTMTVTESSYSVANNTSVVSWNLKLYRPSNISSSASKSYKVVVNGSTVSSGTTTIGGSGTKTIASGTSTISHNADGSKSISFSFSLTMDITWSGTKIGTASKSGSMSLTTIPRATTPTVSASSVDMGNSVTINMPRASSSFTHTLQYTFAGTTTTIGSSLGTSKAWTIPLTLANSIPNATSGTLTFTCITYNGSTKIGSKTVSITAKVPASVIPSASVSVSEAVAKVKNTFGVYVKGLSKLTVTTTGAGSYGSTIKSYKVTANGATYTSSSFTTGVLASSGNMTITATVTDSRGRTKTDSKTISVSNYASPTISGFSASRVDDGDNSNNNDNLSVVIKGNVTSLSGNNGTYKLEYKKSSDSSYANTTGSLTNYAVDTTVTLTGIDKDSSYDLKLTITDGYGNSTPKSIVVPTEFTLVDYHSSGKGIAFGKVAQEANILDSQLAIKEQGKLLSDKYTKYINLYASNVQNDYCYTVIGLCKTSATNTSVDSFTVGRLSFHRVNGLSGAVIVDVAFECQYAGANAINAKVNQYGYTKKGVEPCTFTYNGVVYGGLKVFFDAPGLKGVTFSGASNFDIFALDYYSTSSGVINSEIYNSLKALTPNGNNYLSGPTIFQDTIYLPNNVLIYGTTTSGATIESFCTCSSGNNTTMGYGSYSTQIGTTKVFGNSMEFWSNNTVTINRSLRFANAKYVTGTDTSGNAYDLCGFSSSNVCFLGNASVNVVLRGSTVKLGSTSGSAVTSDINFKTDIDDIDGKYIEFFKKLQPKEYKYKLGNSGRSHLGFIAQDVEQALLDSGLSNDDFGGICIDEVKYAEENEYDERDEMNWAYKQGLNRVYSLRYEEFISLNTTMIQKVMRENEELKAQVDELKSLVSKLISKVGGL